MTDEASLPSSQYGKGNHASKSRRRIEFLLRLLCIVAILAMLVGIGFQPVSEMLTVRGINNRGGRVHYRGRYAEINFSTLDVFVSRFRDPQRFQPGSVNLIGNQFADKDLQNGKWIENCEALHLLRTRITDAGLASLNRFKHLKHLSIESDLLTDEGLRQIPDVLAGLEVLALHGKHFTGCKLGRIDHLEHLDLSNTFASDETLRSLPALPSLKFLYLTNSAVTDDGLMHLDKFPNLSGIDVSQTGITDLGLQHVSELTLAREPKELGLWIIVPITGVTEQGATAFLRKVSRVEVMKRMTPEDAPVSIGRSEQVATDGPSKP